MTSGMTLSLCGLDLHSLAPFDFSTQCLRRAPFSSPPSYLSGHPGLRDSQHWVAPFPGVLLSFLVCWYNSRCKWRPLGDVQCNSRGEGQEGAQEGQGIYWSDPSVPLPSLLFLPP